MVELINSFPDFRGSFGDKRIEKRATQALHKLTRGRNSSIRQVTESDAEQKSFYRLFKSSVASGGTLNEYHAFSNTYRCAVSVR